MTAPPKSFVLIKAPAMMTPQVQASPVAQVSWESAPGVRTPTLAGFHTKANDKEKQQYHEAMSGLLFPGHRDIVAEALGLPIVGQLHAWGAYEGNVNPGTQIMVKLPHPTDKIDPETHKKISAYASILGHLTNQDAMAWHRPMYTGNPEDENGVSVDIGRPLSKEETLSLYDATQKLAGHPHFAPIATETGARFLNFSGDNAKFHDLIHHAVNHVFLDHPDIAPRLVTFASEGDYIDNDPSKGDDNEGYMGRLRAAGASDLFGRLERHLRQRLAAVQRGAGNNFGWNPKFEVTDEEGVHGRDPEGSRKEHLIDHYSKVSNLDVIDPAHMGSAHAGAERDREDRIPRTYVYSGGTIPEPMFLGDHMTQYRLKVPLALYDTNKDIAGYSKQLEEQGIRRGTPDHTTAKEKMIAAGGWDGTLNPDRPDTAQVFRPVRVNGDGTGTLLSPSGEEIAFEAGADGRAKPEPKTTKKAFALAKAINSEGIPPIDDELHHKISSAIAAKYPGEEPEVDDKYGSGIQNFGGYVDRQGRIVGTLSNHKTAAAHGLQSAGIDHQGDPVKTLLRHGFARFGIEKGDAAHELHDAYVELSHPLNDAQTKTLEGLREQTQAYVDEPYWEAPGRFSVEHTHPLTGERTTVWDRHAPESLNWLKGSHADVFSRVDRMALRPIGYRPVTKAFAFLSKAVKPKTHEEVAKRRAERAALRITEDTPLGGETDTAKHKAGFSPNQERLNFQPQAILSLAKLLGMDNYKMAPAGHGDADIRRIIALGQEGRHWYDDWRTDLHHVPVESVHPETGQKHESLDKRMLFGMLGSGTSPRVNFGRFTQALSRHDAGFYQTSDDANDLNHREILPHLAGSTGKIPLDNIVYALQRKLPFTPKLVDFSSGFLYPHERKEHNWHSNPPIDEWEFRGMAGKDGAPEHLYDFYSGRLSHATGRNDDPHDDEIMRDQAAHWVGIKKHFASIAQNLISQVVEKHGKKDTYGNPVTDEQGSPVFDGKQAKAAQEAVQKAQKWIGDIFEAGDSQTVLRQFGMKKDDGSYKSLPVFASHQIVYKHKDKLKELTEKPLVNVYEAQNYPIMDTSDGTRERVTEMLLHPANKPILDSVPEAYRPRLREKTEAGRWQDAVPGTGSVLYGDKGAVEKLLKEGVVSRRDEAGKETFVSPGEHYVQSYSDKSDIDPSLAPAVPIRFHRPSGYKKFIELNPESAERLHSALADPDFRRDMAHLGKIVERKEKGVAKTGDPFTSYAYDGGDNLTMIASKALAHARQAGEDHLSPDTFYKEGTEHDQHYQSTRSVGKGFGFPRRNGTGSRAAIGRGDTGRGSRRDRGTGGVLRTEPALSEQRGQGGAGAPAGAGRVTVLIKAPAPQTAPGTYNNHIAKLKQHVTPAADPAQDFAERYGNALHWILPDYDPDFREHGDAARSLKSLEPKVLHKVMNQAQEHAEGDMYNDHPRNYLHDPKFESKQWMVHFTPFPHSVAQHGFKFGHPDLEGVHATTWKPKRNEKAGYNYAYSLNQPEIVKETAQLGAEGKSFFGNHFVVFPSATVKVDHQGDHENQHIFWGEGVHPRDIHPVEFDTYRQEYKALDAHGSVRYKHEDPMNVAKWVQDNSSMLSDVKRSKERKEKGEWVKGFAILKAYASVTDENGRKWVGRSSHDAAQNPTLPERAATAARTTMIAIAKPAKAAVSAMSGVVERNEGNVRGEFQPETQADRLRRKTEEAEQRRTQYAQAQAGRQSTMPDAPAGLDRSVDETGRIRYTKKPIASPNAAAVNDYHTGRDYAVPAHEVEQMTPPQLRYVQQVADQINAHRKQVDTGTIAVDDVKEWWDRWHNRAQKHPLPASLEAHLEIFLRDLHSR